MQLTSDNHVVFHDVGVKGVARKIEKGRQKISNLEGWRRKMTCLKMGSITRGCPFH